MSGNKLKRIDGYKHVSQMDDKEAADFIMAEIRKAIANKGRDFIRCERYDRLYQSLDQADQILDPTTGDVSDDATVYSNTHLPIGAWLVDTATIQVYKQIFSTPDYFGLEADDWQDEPKAYKVKAHLMRRHREMQFRSQIFRAVQAAMTFDYAVTYDTWKVRFGKKPTVINGVDDVEIGGINLKYKNTKTEWREGVVQSRSDIQLIDYFQCAHDYQAGPKIEESKMFCDWSRPQLWELLKEEQAVNPIGVYKNLDQVYAAVANGMGIDMSSEAREPADKNKQPERERIRKFRFWTHDEVFELAQGFVIRRYPADGMPLSVWRAYELPNRFRGMGVLQRIERMCLDINAIINQKRDFGNLVNNPIAVLSSDIPGIDEGDTALFPGRTLVGPGDVTKKIAFYQPGATFQGSTEELMTQIEMTKATSGFGSDNAGGSATPTARTAREISAVAAGILSKTSVVAERYEEENMVPILMRQFRMEQMYMSKSERLKYHGVNGTDFIIIRPEDYAWGSIPNFEMKGSSYAGYHDVYIQQYMKALAVTMQLAPERLNKDNAIAHLWQLLVPSNYMNFIQDPRTPDHNIPQNMENLILAMGHHVPVSPLNDHKAHIANLETLMISPDYQVWPQSFKANAERHKKDHQTAMLPKGAPTGASMPMGGATPQSQDPSDLMRGVRGSNLSV